MNARARVLTAGLWVVSLGVVVPGFSQSPPAPDVPQYPRINLAAGFELDARWPRKPAEFDWKDMPGVAVDAQDQVWVFNRGNVPVQVYGREGNLIRSWGREQVGRAHHIKIDPEGNVWLADIGLHVVRKFTPEGKLLLTLGTPGSAGADAHHLNQPTDMAITPSGDIFVSDGYGNNRVVHFDRQGRFVREWGKLGVRPGEFSLPHAIGVDSQGRLYVADRNNARVQVFDQQGKFLSEWRNLLVPWGIWITSRDEIYVCGSSPMLWGEGNHLGVPPKDQLIMKFTPEGKVVQLWTFPKGQDGQERPGELNWVHGIAVDSAGNLYLGDIRGQRAQKFSPVH